MPDLLVDDSGHRWCDLCGWPHEAAWVHPTRRIAGEITPRPNHWLACSDCHELVQGTRRDELAERATHVRSAGALLAGADHLRFNRERHDDFWAARDGVPRPLRSRS